MRSRSIVVVDVDDRARFVGVMTESQPQRFGTGGGAANDAESWRRSSAGGADADWSKRQPSVLAKMDERKRERASAEDRELDEKENAFHLSQAKLRADIRIREGRAKAIDLIARNVFAETYIEFDVFVNPLTVLSGLSLRELEETKKELQELRDLDTRDGKRREFWTALIALTETEMTEEQQKEEIERARVRGEASERVEASSLHADIDDDVVEIVSGKSAAELAELEGEISEQIQGPDASEVEYWGAVLKRVSMAKTKAIVEEMHKSLKVKFEGEEIEDGGRARARNEQRLAEDEGGDDDLLGADFGKHVEDEDGHGGDDSEWNDDSAEAKVKPEYAPSLSPMRLTEVEEGIEIIDISQEEANLTRLREQERIRNMSRFKKVTSENRVLRGKTEDDVYNAFKQAGGAHHNTGVLGNLITGTTDFKDIEKQVDRKAKDFAERMMGATEDGDENFGDEAELESQAYWWHDKYRPRKPKYFNRVHTGYTWNKYNQTHYDSSNPPPKTVQGYKFNVFYPDLIDTSKAPTYKIEPDGSANADTCLLKISAGPPYEDIAFRIVNKEWEYGHKRGFRCTFERGIFHLYFNFKRPRYRR